MIKTIIENNIKYTLTIDDFKNIRWYKEGTDIFHRENGPAVEYADGTKVWYREGKIHREDGPAVQKVNGYKAWYKEGKLHRENGPAIELTNGKKEYWINSKCLENIQTDEELIIKLLLE